MSEIKLIIDKERQAGKFLLTGYQQFNLIQGLRESLAGRVLLLRLNPMTLMEKAGLGGEPHWLSDLLENGISNKSFKKNETTAISPIEAIHQGGLPEILSITKKFRPGYFESFIQTYLERDLSAILPGSDITGLSRFLRLLAPLTCCEINKLQLGRELSISAPTSNRWLERLKSTFVWMETPSLAANYIKRVAKHPKGNLFDTGIICSLLMIPDAESLSLHPSVGTLFEAAMRIELQAVIDSFLLSAKMYHWRPRQGKEVDIVIEYRNKLYAFECKWKSELSDHDIRGLVKFRETFPDKTAFLGVLTPTGHHLRLRNDIHQIPWIPK